MAFREAETLGLAHMLVARKRQELELQVARETVTKGTEPAGATIDHALKDMQDRGAHLQRDPPPVGDAGVLVNKTA